MWLANKPLRQWQHQTCMYTDGFPYLAKKKKKKVVRESSCLLPDVLCLGSYTCGLHYFLPPARRHADDMNNRSPTIKLRSVGDMVDVPNRRCRPLHLDWKGRKEGGGETKKTQNTQKKTQHGSPMVKCAAWLGGGLGVGLTMAAGSWEETPKCAPAGEGDVQGKHKTRLD